MDDCPTITLRRGDRGPAVSALQTLLVQGGRKVKVDGILGPQTLREAHSLLGLEPDNEISDKEIDAIEALSAPHAQQPLNQNIERVWAFADFSLPGEDEINRWLRQITDLNLTDVVFGLNSETDATFKRTLNLARISVCARALRDLGIDVHLMSWLRPDEAYQRDASVALMPLCTDPEINPASLMFDVEHYWIKHFSREPQAISWFGRFFLNPHNPWPCPLGVTSYASLPSAVAPLLPHVDYGLPQAYSVWTEKKWTQQPSVQPGPMQELAAKTWAASKKIVMGLANYSQTRPGMTQREAMEKALAASRARGIKEVAYWSKKNVGGSSASSRERREIMAGIRG